MLYRRQIRTRVLQAIYAVCQGNSSQDRVFDQLLKHQTSFIEKAIRIERSIIEFKRAWITAQRNEKNVADESEVDFKNNILHCRLQRLELYTQFFMAIEQELLEYEEISPELYNKRIERHGIFCENQKVKLINQSKKPIATDTFAEEEKISDLQDLMFFINELFFGTLKAKSEYEPWIRSKVENWEYERIALIDKIILVMAVHELLSFPTIPVKVTLNEYIELAKHFSTERSNQFINGLLDPIAAELLAAGKIHKSGRGLDNALEAKESPSLELEYTISFV